MRDGTPQASRREFYATEGQKKSSRRLLFFLDGDGAVYAGDFSAGLDVRAYFWRKRSTRPAVSTIFCLPV